MGNKFTIALTASAVAFSFMSCKKDDKNVFEQEMERSQSAAMNVEIKKLSESLKEAKTDIEKSALNTKIASIQSDKGDVMSAVKSSLEASRLQPENHVSRYLLGKSYNDLGRYDDAITELRASVKIKDDFAPAHFELGNSYYKKFKYPDAVDEYKAAVKLDPNHYQAYNNMGVVQSSLGKFNEAENSFKSVTRVNPGYVFAYKNLGVLYETKLKNFPLAVELYKKYLAVSPNCPERNKVRRWIKVLGG